MPTEVCATCGEPFPDGVGTCPNDGTPLATGPTGITKDPLIGQRVGEYLVEALIGMGGMGLVYRGIQPDISKRVAIKVLRPDIAADPMQVQRLLAEARAVNEIRHRSIIDIFGFGSLPDGRQYVVMEFLDGEPLDELIKKTAPMVALQALPLLEEVCSALSAAHGRGVIHRDLKPSNIFVATQQDGSRFVKLLDFGLAKRGALPNAPTSQTNQGLVAGTPDYMAPEQARGDAVGPQTDLYSLGVMAFEMLTGQLPFDAPTVVELLLQHMKVAPPAPSSLEPSISAELDNFVLKLMAKEMGRRPPSAEIVRAELKRLVRDLKQQATQVGVRPEVWHVTGEHRAAPTTRLITPVRSRVGVIATAATLTAALALGVGALARRPATPDLPAPVVVAPPPPVPLPLEPEPTPPPAPAVEAPAISTPAAAPRPPKTARSAALSAAAVQERIGRLELALRNKSPGQPPNPDALAFLKRKKLESTFSDAKLAEIARYLDQWEKTFLR